MRQIVLDTETTGLEVEQGHRIIEIGSDGKVLVNTSETTSMAHFIDTGSFKVLEFFGIVVPEVGNLWRDRALVGGFYIFKHEYVILFEKPAK